MHSNLSKILKTRGVLHTLSGEYMVNYTNSDEPVLPVQHTTLKDFYAQELIEARNRLLNDQEESIFQFVMDTDAPLPRDFRKGHWALPKVERYIEDHVLVPYVRKEAIENAKAEIRSVPRLPEQHIPLAQRLIREQNPFAKRCFSVERVSAKLTPEECQLLGDLTLHIYGYQRTPHPLGISQDNIMWRAQIYYARAHEKRQSEVGWAGAEHLEAIADLMRYYFSVLMYMNWMQHKRQRPTKPNPMAES